MKTSTQDQVEGTAKKIVGKAAADVGRSNGDKELQHEGQKTELKGAVQKKVGDIKQVFGK